MYNKLFLLSVFLFSMTSVFAQQHATTLWEISKAGMKHKSYVFGTNHAVKGSYLNKLSAVNEALKNSEALMTEADYFQKNIIDTSRSIALHYIPYREILDSASYIFLDSVMLSVKNPSLDTLNLQKVPFVNVFQELLQNRIFDFGGIDVVNLDEAIYNQSAELNKSFKSLDGGTKALTKDDEKSSVQKLLGKTLIDVFKSPEDLKELKKEVDNFYLNKKEYSFNQHVKLKGTEQSKFMSKKLLLERNDLWLPLILESVNNRGTFIAVGFEHLRFKEGILKQLEKNGFQIKPKDLMINEL